MNNICFSLQLFVWHHKSRFSNVVLNTKENIFNSFLNICVSKKVMLRKVWICLYLLKKSLLGNFSFLCYEKNWVNLLENITLILFSVNKSNWCEITVQKPMSGSIF